MDLLGLLSETGSLGSRIGVRGSSRFPFRIGGF